MKIIILIILLATASLGGYWIYEQYLKNDSTTTVNDYFNVNAFCNGAKQCVYNGKDIDVNVVITNISSEQIEMPINFLSQRGPSITLLNTDTEKTYVIPTNPPNSQLLADRMVIAPNQTARISWIIKDQEIREIAGDAVNIVADVQISSPVYQHNTATEAKASSSFVITH